MISDFFDWIERRVSTVKKIHEAVYKEEPYPVYKLEEKQPLASNVHIKQYAQAVAQANSYQQYGLANQGIIGTYISTGTPITSVGGPLTAVSISPSYQQSAMAMPYPTGALVTVAFTDANGVPWAITVDQAYAGMLGQISQMHSYRNGYATYQAPIATPPPTHTKMVDGDFSFDEMETAELIIQELSQGHGEPARHETQGAS